MNFVRLSVACFTVFMLGASLFSQGSAGRILGSVTDQTGAIIPGVTVTIRDVDRGTTRTIVTDEAGLYNAPNLLPGTYTIRVELSGFATAERPNIKLEVGQDIRVDVSLRPGQQNEVVTVQAESPLIETNNAELGGTIANGINSNDPWMAQSMMNAVMAAGDAGTMLPIDAIDEFKTQQNPGAEYGWKPGAIVNVGVKSGTNAVHGTAYAYGRNSAWDARNFFETPGTPKVPVELEQFGGSLGGAIRKDQLFYFLNFEQQRYSVGNAVQHKVPITAPGVGSATQNLIAACNAVRATGPVAGLSAQLAGLSTDCVPLANFPGLFPVNAGPTIALNTSLTTENQINSGLGKVDYHLNANHSFSGMYFVSPGEGVFVDNPTLQIAHPWLTNQYARSQVISGNWTWVASNNLVNSFRSGYSRYYQVFQSVDHTQNAANYNYNGTTYHMYTGQTNPVYFGLPGFAFQGGFSFQFGLGWPKIVGPDSVYQVTDSVSLLHGKHATKFGGEILVNQSTNNVTANTKGPVRFPNLQSFFNANMNRALFAAGDFLRHLQNEGYGLFVQDDWRATPKITLNLGLRYEINTVVKEANNLMGNFDPNVGLAQVGKQVGSVYNGNHNKFAPRVGLAWDIGGNGRTVVRAGGGVYFEQGSFDTLMALGNLLGLRTLPTGVALYTNRSLTPSTAGGTINVGAITFTGAALGSQTAAGTIKYNWANNSASTPIYSASPVCGDGTVTLRSGLTPQPCTIMGIDRNLRTPYVSKWNLDIQHAITNNLSVDIAYVGNHGTKLVGLTEINQPQLVGGFSPGWGNPAVPASPAGRCVASAPKFDNCNPDTAAEQAARPFASRFPYLSYINWLSNNNVSNYHGLQASMTQRTSHGVSFVLGYTFAHALGMSPDNWSFFNPINSNRTRDLYGPSRFDVRHRFTYSLTYAVRGMKTPGQILEGWSINSILSIQSGLPWGVNDTTTDFSGTGEINGQNSNGERWNFFGNPEDFKTTKTLLNTNGGTGGIPYFPGSSNPDCLAKAQAAGPLAVASLTNLGCYASGKSILAPPAYGSYGTVGRDVFRSMPYYNWDLSVTKAWKFQERVTTQFRAEFFNVLNHPNISNPFGGPGGGATYTDPSGTAGTSFGFRPETPDVTSSNPVLGSGGHRAMQLGLKIIF